MQAIIYDVIGYEVKPHFISEDELASYNNVNTKEVQEPQVQHSSIDDKTWGKEQFNMHNTFDTLSLDLVTVSHMLQV